MGDGMGSWSMDGKDASHLDGCLDVDLESSAMTNSLPVLRLGLPVGTGAWAPAVHVRVGDGGVQRLEQHYTRVSDQAGRPCFDYSAPAFDFTAGSSTTRQPCCWTTRGSACAQGDPDG